MVEAKTYCLAILICIVDKIDLQLLTDRLSLYGVFVSNELQSYLFWLVFAHWLWPDFQKSYKK